MIEARDICVEINSKTLLQNVSLALNAGEVLAIVGQNGSGKSTLRRALCGDVKLSSGEVLMNGKTLAAWSIAERARLRAVMNQDSTLNFPFTVLEVALMGRAPHIKGGETKLDYEIARRALRLVEAEHLEERLYPTLSGGERQRAQLARALAQIWRDGDQDNSSRANDTRNENANDDDGENKTRYIFLDEPTSNLDLAHQHSALETARRFAREGAGVFVILHDLNLAAQYADRVLMLKDGGVIACGAPSEIFTTELIEETFNVRVAVAPHPQLDCPLIISAGRITKR